ncbi:MAG: Na+/H+ antiporter subunit G [Pseudoxanthomonas suwonensis]|nr:MAG: Na+/H+ antiporter subunit G [Pseudoxanthomonas suwonensis]
MTQLLDVVVVCLLAISSLFILVGAFALIKLPTFFQRIHGPTKASTLGVGGILITSILYHAMVGNSFHPRELLITLFLFMTAPISAYMMARAAFSRIQRAGGDASLPPPPPGMDASGGASGSSPAHSETQDDGAPSPRP